LTRTVVEKLLIISRMSKVTIEIKCNQNGLYLRAGWVFIPKQRDTTSISQSISQFFSAVTYIANTTME